MNKYVIQGHNHPNFEDREYDPISGDDIAQSICMIDSIMQSIVFDKNGVWLYKPSRQMINFVKHVLVNNFSDMVRIDPRHGCGVFGADKYAKHLMSFIEFSIERINWFNTLLLLKEPFAYNDTDNEGKNITKTITLDDKITIDEYIDNIGEYIVYGDGDGKTKTTGFDISYQSWDKPIQINLMNKKKINELNNYDIDSKPFFNLEEMDTDRIIHLLSLIEEGNLLRDE